MFDLDEAPCLTVSLQLALDSARFEFTLKMRLNRIWPKDPTYAIFLKSWVFKDVKYDIPMCQYHSTRPQPIQLVPTMQKKLFTSSFQAKFLKIWFTKFTDTSSFLVCQQNFFFPSLYHSHEHIWAKIPRYAPPLTPRKCTLLTKMVNLTKTITSSSAQSLNSYHF